MNELNMSGDSEFFGGSDLPDRIVVEHSETGETQAYEVVDE